MLVVKVKNIYNNIIIILMKWKKQNYKIKFINFKILMKMIKNFILMKFIEFFKYKKVK